MRSYLILRFTFIISIFTFCIGCNSTITETPVGKSQTKYVGGIQINEANQTDWAKTIKACGMNLAQVTAYAKQGDWDSDHLWWEDSDTTNVINEIRAIKAQGVHVLLVLRVALQHNHPKNKFKWHGMIFPKDEALRKEWFYRYSYFVEMWSKICEREGVDIFAIGSEMNALTATESIDKIPSLLEYFSNEKKQKDYLSRVFKHRANLTEENLWVRGFDNYSSEEEYIEDKITEQKNWADVICHVGEQEPLKLMNQERLEINNYWKQMIARARDQYSGKITLAANFDNYREVNFWSDLDCIGINAYFPLRKFENKAYNSWELDSTLQLGWSGILDTIETFKSKNGIDSMPIFFTEIGYTPKANSTIEPWQGDGFSLLSNGAIDTLLVWKNVEDRPEERSMAIDALRRVVAQKEFPLLGLSYWKMTSHDYHQGQEPFMLLLKPEQPSKLVQTLSNFLK